MKTMFKISETLFYNSLSLLSLCGLLGLVVFFRQQAAVPSAEVPQRETPAVRDGGGGPDPPRGSVSARRRAADTGVRHKPPQSTPFADTMDRAFYQTIIRNNLFAPLGTVLHPDPEPGAHLSLLGTFVSEDPSASSVLVKNATTGRHHRLSVGEGVGDFYVLSVEPKQVRFYHHGTEVTLHLPETVFLNAKRR